MDRAILEQLVTNLSQRQIAKTCNVSQSTIKYWLAKFNLKTNSTQNIPLDFCCSYCGETDLAQAANSGNGRISKSTCKKCHNLNTIQRIRRYKRQAVDYKGGKCETCEYDKCLGALEFHHRDSSDKDPQWSKMKNWHFEKIKVELDKCDLLCSNCHKELHWS